MKILYISPGVFDKGGISRYNRYQVEALRNIYGTNKVRVLSLHAPDFESFETGFKVQWHGNGAGLLSKLKFTCQIFCQIIIWAPNLIFVGHVNHSGLVHAISKLRRIPVVLNIYGLEVWSGFSKSAAWGLKNVPHVISDCHYTANFVENQGIREKGTTLVIWDCVNLEQFKPSLKNASIVKNKYNLPDRDKYFVILTLGRIAKEAAHKGYERLLDVFEHVIQEYPNARLVFGCKGNMVDHLKDIIRKKGLEQSVTFTGVIHEDDMSALYSYAHVFSLVSDRGKGRGEGIPLTPLEAMACGTPIIVGNQDGSQEAIIHDRNGYSIDSLDLKKHYAVIREMIESPTKLEELSKEAAVVAQEVFCFEQFQNKHQKFIIEMTEN